MKMYIIQNDWFLYQVWNPAVVVHQVVPPVSVTRAPHQAHYVNVKEVTHYIKEEPRVTVHQAEPQRIAVHSEPRPAPRVHHHVQEPPRIHSVHATNPASLPGAGNGRISEIREKLHLHGLSG